MLRAIMRSSVGRFARVCVSVFFGGGTHSTSQGIPPYHIKLHCRSSARPKPPPAQPKVSPGTSIHSCSPKNLRSAPSTCAYSFVSLSSSDLMEVRHTSADSGLEPVSSIFLPRCWIFSQLFLIRLRPRVADEPLR